MNWVGLFIIFYSLVSLGNEGREVHVSKGPKIVRSVIMSKANVQYSFKKKNFGKMKAIAGKGLVVKKVHSESLLENLALKKGDVVLECNGEELVGKKGMQRLIKTAVEQSQFSLLVRRGKSESLFKYQQ